MAEDTLTSRSENFSDWYNELVLKAELADYSPVRGCMVVRPYGWSLWENIQQALDKRFKETGHTNATFPLLIPKSFLEKEKEHVEGFSPELAVVTIGGGEELEEPLVVRPTSETIIGHMYSKWVKSWRDLPILINQWGNVVRWEMRTKLFLRTSEFFWQEGHTAHATEQEAREETFRMLDVYADFAINEAAVPVIKGIKSETEKFAGAVMSTTIEAMMGDTKALQSGTSHFLGQNFAKASEIKYRDADGNVEFAWTTSWGVTTRMIGALIMTHSDDDGLIMPPRIASSHIVLLPVIHREETKDEVLSYCKNLAQELNKVLYHGQNVVATVDTRDMRGGEKTWSWIKKGIPLRLEIGPRDIANSSLGIARRDKAHKELTFVSREQIAQHLPKILDDIQEGMLKKAEIFRDSHIKKIDSKEEFYAFFTPKNPQQPEVHGGFAYSHWCGDPEVEEIVKKDLNVTIRCVPLHNTSEEGLCVISGKKSTQRVLFAKSY